MNPVRREDFEATEGLQARFEAACAQGKQPGKIQQLLCERGVHTQRSQIINMRNKLAEDVRCDAMQAAVEAAEAGAEA